MDILTGVLFFGELALTAVAGVLVLRYKNR